MSNDAGAIDLLAMAFRLVPDEGRALLGIAGPPASGKSTLARWLVEAVNSGLGDSSAAALVPLDGFHLSNQRLAALGRSARKGAPDTFDVSGFVALLGRVREAYEIEAVYAPEYRRMLHEPIAAGLVVPAPARLVVVEGNYLLLDRSGWSGVAALLDESWYLDTPETVRQERLLKRHQTSGRSLFEAEAWVHSVDLTNAALIASSRSRASRVVEVREDLPGADAGI